jgi:hypothetical protein
MGSPRDVTSGAAAEVPSLDGPMLQAAKKANGSQRAAYVTNRRMVDLQ